MAKNYEEEKKKLKVEFSINWEKFGKTFCSMFNQDEIYLDLKQPIRFCFKNNFSKTSQL